MNPIITIIGDYTFEEYSVDRQIIIVHSKAGDVYMRDANVMGCTALIPNIRKIEIVDGDLKCFYRDKYSPAAYTIVRVDMCVPIFKRILSIIQAPGSHLSRTPSVPATIDQFLMLCCATGNLSVIEDAYPQGLFANNDLLCKCFKIAIEENQTAICNYFVDALLIRK